MKKGVVLFVTLLFIASVSVLIVANMKDTQSYIGTNNSKFNITQSYHLISDLQKSVSKKLSSIENKNNIDAYIANNFTENIVFDLKNINFKLDFSKYDKPNINDLISNNQDKRFKIEEKLILYEVFNFSILYEYLDKNKVISSNGLKDLVLEYEKNTREKIVPEFDNTVGFLDNSEDNLYKLDIEVFNIDEKILAYYILDNKGEIAHYETSIK